MSSEHPTVQDWIERISERNLAELTATVQRVHTAVAREGSSLRDITQALGSDPAIREKIIAIANSPNYQVGPDPVTTVERAAALIGFDGVSNICITNRLLEVLLVEKHLSPGVAERLLRRTAASLHAALQARMMADAAGLREREQAFVSALLEHIGECAFWGVGGAELESLDARLGGESGAQDAAIVELVGGSFAELGASLIEAWQLAGSKRAGDPQVAQQIAEIARLANQVADRVARTGWYSPALDLLCERAGALMGVSEEEAARRIRDCGRQAEEIAHAYGAGILARRMSPGTTTEQSAAPRPAGRRAGARGDPDIHFATLQQLAALREAPPDPNRAIQAALEGILRGVGTDRAIAALLDRERRTLTARFWLGDGGERWSKQFRFEHGAREGIFHECLENRRALRYSSTAPGELARAVPVALSLFSKAGDMLLAPIVAGTRTIGLLYADRTPSGGAIGTEDFEAFAALGAALDACLGPRDTAAR